MVVSYAGYEFEDLAPTSRPRLKGRTKWRNHQTRLNGIKAEEEKFLVKLLIIMFNRKYLVSNEVALAHGTLKSLQSRFHRPVFSQQRRRLTSLFLFLFSSASVRPGPVSSVILLSAEYLINHLFISIFMSKVDLMFFLTSFCENQPIWYVPPPFV